MDRAGVRRRREGALRRAGVLGLGRRCLPISWDALWPQAVDELPGLLSSQGEASEGRRLLVLAWLLEGPPGELSLRLQLVDLRPRAWLPRGRERGRGSDVISAVRLEEGARGLGPAARAAASWTARPAPTSVSLAGAWTVARLGCKGWQRTPEGPFCPPEGQCLRSRAGTCWLQKV